MKVRDFIDLYKKDSLVQAAAEKIKSNAPFHLRLKGLAGSSDAVVAGAISALSKNHHLFILEDREEAAYFQNDLQNILGVEVLMFPISYKKPYSFEETENANVLMRSEVLNRINDLDQEAPLIVTYPEALCEKVINKQSLVQHTYEIRKGSKINITELTNLLISYDFEAADFVYEAGQFSVRGGIIDIFSFSNEYPYRIELFGDEVESIRTFDPSNQLSQEDKKVISLIPNVQTRLLQESRESLLTFLPRQSCIWFKEAAHAFDVVGQYFEKVEESFMNIAKQAGGKPVVSAPGDIFMDKGSFEQQAKDYLTVEFGNSGYFNPNFEVQFDIKPQQAFNKNFDLFLEDVNKNDAEGFKNIMVAESEKDIDKLQTIVEENIPHVTPEPLYISFRQGYRDINQSISCYTAHELFGRYYRYKTKERFSKTKALTLKELKSLQPGDYVTHIDYGVGRFAGMEMVDTAGKKQEAIRIVYKDDDLLYVSVHSLHKISKYSGKDGGPPQMSKLGSQEWENKKKRIKRKVKDIAKELIKLYAKRKAAKGFAYSKDSFLQAELEGSFIYEDTPDQAKATADVKADMEEPHPMDRLVCGDVGFGKTEVAVRAAFKAVCDGKQVAVLVPTTLLALQHYKTFKERLEKLPCTVDYVSRFRSAKQIRETLTKVKSGDVDILIGTHRLVGKDVQFVDLGLMIIDEEQRFGVKTKEKLKEMKFNVDALTLTATPIPRTLQFSLMGARDLSIITTPPPNRQPVTTEVTGFGEEVIRDAISYELKRGGQVFFVHNRIGDIDQIANIILKLVPDAKIGVAHGQMEGDKLEKVMMRFIEGYYDVLVSTNIIESGIDIPNANTIMINKAHMFGLADLHQMRGRVGRSNRKAFCYLLTPEPATLSSDSRKRLRALEEFSDLGDGFKVAMKDLDIRGAGNILGGEQSGFINDIGMEAYHKILDETIQELKETEFKDLFHTEIDIKSLVTDCTIETDLEILIPEDYVKNISERLRLYTELDNITTQEALDKFESNMHDRFGALPESVIELIKTVKLRWMAEKGGFAKLKIKNDTMRAYFASMDDGAYFQSAIFSKILQYVQQNPKGACLKEIGTGDKKKLLLIFEKTSSINKAIAIFEEMVESEVPVS